VGHEKATYSAKTPLIGRAKSSNGCTSSLKKLCANFQNCASCIGGEQKYAKVERARAVDYTTNGEIKGLSLHIPHFDFQWAFCIKN